MISATEAKIMTNDVTSERNSSIIKELDQAIRKAAEKGLIFITYHGGIPPAVWGVLTDLKYKISEYPAGPGDKSDKFFTISW